MPMTRAQKQEMIDTAHATLKDSSVMILVHNNGMTVAQVSELRRRVREAGASYRVVKNRLAKLAAKDTPFEHISGMLKGPTAMATSADPVAAAKAIVEYAKINEKLVVLGGAFGERVLDVKGVEQLAKMPSLDQLRSTLIALIQTPGTRIASILQAPAGQVARVIGAHARKEG